MRRPNIYKCISICVIITYFRICFCIRRYIPQFRLFQNWAYSLFKSHLILISLRRFETIIILPNLLNSKIFVWAKKKHKWSLLVPWMIRKSSTPCMRVFHSLRDFTSAMNSFILLYWTVKELNYSYCDSDQLFKKLVYCIIEVIFLFNDNELHTCIILVWPKEGVAVLCYFSLEL